MSNTKISALVALTGANVSTSTDVFAIVDDSASQTKKILVNEASIAMRIQRFQSSDQTITSAGTLTIPHGLSNIPSVVAAVLVCQSGEQGFSNGDLLVTTPDAQDSTALGRGISVVVDATNLTVRFGNDATCFVAINKSGGNAVALTNANWKLRLTAYA